MLFLTYWPTNRKESQPEMSLGCLFFWLPVMSACQACVCVRVCMYMYMCLDVCGVCVSHMGCCHHRQRGCCDISPSFVTLEDKTISLDPHLPNTDSKYQIDFFLFLISYESKVDWKTHDINLLCINCWTVFAIVCIVHLLYILSLWQGRIFTLVLACCS